MQYRPEVDGLRAVAVVPVILFHAGFRAVSGGYVGVDVFFVISGYLITSIILAELAHGRFSLVNFYERRARRILPALFLVLFVMLPFAWIWLLPRDLKNLSQELTAVAAFASNMLFWREQGYFDTAAELKPLLHTWSLAVEEQYYVIFPLLLMLAWPVGRRRLLAILAVAGVASLAAAEWMVTRKPGTAFYLLPFRGWELLLGAAVAFYFSRHSEAPFGRRTAEAGSLFGLVLIVVAVFTFDKATPFPGLYALAPTLGAALVILFASPATLTGRLLASKLFVGIGLVSYSAYLWHQPLFAIARHRSLAEPSTYVFAILALVSLALAYISWKYVETPFRDKRRIDRRRIFSFAAAGSVFFAVVGLAGQMRDGFPSRLPDDVRNLAHFEERNRANNINACKPVEGLPHEVVCVIGNPNRVVGALLGDSHAGALLHVLGKGLTEKGIGLLNMNFGCPPARGLYRVDLGRRDKCDEHNRKVFDYLASHRNLEYVVMSARWSLYMERTGYDNGEGGVEHLDESYVDVVVNGVKQRSEESTRRALVKQKYYDAVDDYLKSGKKVILVYPVPEVGWDVPSYIAKRRLFGLPAEGDLTHDYQAYLKRSAETRAALDSVGERTNLSRVRPEKIFCDTVVPGRCIAQRNGVPMYFDDDHLSNAGAAVVSEEIMNFVRPQPQPQP